MGKATLLTPVYMSVAWTLMTTYQLFTEITVNTITNFIVGIVPIVGEWMIARIDLIVFIHSFAWIFLLSSFIPGVLLGKKRGVLMQFGVCLTLAVLANVVQGAVADASGGPLDQILGLAPLFGNPLLATLYMSLPYALMAGFDIRGKRKSIEIMRNTKEKCEFPEIVFGIVTQPVIQEKTQEKQSQAPPAKV
ncbi:MAG TPA: hypothetical protein ENO13_01520 [Candidatus Bathyarchaeota archaeon]|nr:hypothetical protein [Candidatus Bathyarchaeota archaeon]